MTLRERLTVDMKEAMKAHDELRLTVLRGLIGNLNNKAIEKRTKTLAKDGQAGKDEALTDEETNQALMTEAKRRKESAEVFTQGGRSDLAEKETAELAVIQAYLPKQMSPAETETAVEKILARTATKEFGPVMKSVMAELRGQADAKLITEILKKKLG